MSHLHFFVLPLLAAGLCGYFGYRVAIIREISPVVAVPVSLVSGTVILGATITGCGNDMMNFNVSSLIFIAIVLV